MMPGDIPCNEACCNTLCHYCLGGHCLDNSTCAAQTSPEEWNTRDDGD